MILATQQIRSLTILFGKVLTLQASHNEFHYENIVYDYPRSD